jgi:hypothetical protein
MLRGYLPLLDGKWLHQGKVIHEPRFQQENALRVIDLLGVSESDAIRKARRLVRM